jgi:hypothetical protein
VHGVLVALRIYDGANSKYFIYATSGILRKEKFMVDLSFLPNDGVESNTPFWTQYITIAP